MAPTHTKAYLATQIKTADRTGVIIALYEAAIAYVNQAMEAVENGNADQRRTMIEKTSRIIEGLSAALDFTQNNGLAGDLFALYNYQLQQLLEANRNDDLEPLQAVKSTLSILLKGWQQVARSDAVRELEAESEATASRRRSTNGERPSVVLTA